MKPTELFSAGISEINNRLPFGLVSKFKKQTIEGQSGKRLLSACLSRYNCRIIPIASIIMIVCTFVTGLLENGITGGELFSGGAAEIVGEVLILVTAVFGVGFGFYFSGRYPSYYPYVFWGMYLLAYFIKVTGCAQGASGLSQTAVTIAVISIVPIFNIGASIVFLLSVPVYYAIVCSINDVMAYYPFTAFSLALLGIAVSLTTYTLFCARMINSKKIKEDKQRIELKSKIDSATGLYSREYGIETAKRLLEQGKGIALLVVDIDKFGEYNRSFGTSKADKTLREIANCIKIVSKPYTDITCHFESDRILLCMTADADKEPVMLSEEIRSSVKMMNISFPANTAYMTVTATVGMARSTYGDIFDSVFEKAVRSLEVGKKAGGNCIAYKEHIFRPQ